MELVYATEKLEEVCTKEKVAIRFFNGDNQLAVKLLSRVNALKQAETLRDIVVQKQFHFHKLGNKGKRNLEGCFAMDVKSRANPWRVILQSLDDQGRTFIPCNIDEIAGTVKVVEIMEVSKHYE